MIGAGGVTSPGTVTLNGDIDLNASTLYLRGCGAGAINGAIREGGDDAIRKMDTGTWTLSGANTFTGLVTIAGGTLKVGASGAVASATPVAVAGGAVYLDSDDPGTEWAVQTMRMEAGNYRLWVNEKGYGPDTGTATFTPFTRLGDGGLSADFAEVLVYTRAC